MPMENSHALKKSSNNMKFASLALLLFIFPLLISAQDTAGKYFTSFDGAKIYYEVKGSGKPVLLVHGYLNSGENWKGGVLYGELQKQGFQVITVDMRGNGKSDKPHNFEAYANDAEAKDIMGLLKEIGIKKYDVLGYSRGAIITARLLVLDKRIDKAVLGGMGLDFTNPEWPRRIMFYRAMMGDSIPEAQGAVKYVQSAGLDQLAQAYLQKEQPSTSKEELGKLKNKVLIICGTEDSDNGSASELAAAIPNSTFVSVPGNHGGAARTKEFAEAVVKFLR